jgi:hypothetical protein
MERLVRLETKRDARTGRTHGEQDGNQEDNQQTAQDESSFHQHPSFAFGKVLLTARPIIVLSVKPSCPAGLPGPIWTIGSNHLLAGYCGGAV